MVCVGMARKQGQRNHPLVRLDARVLEAIAPYSKSSPVRAIAFVSKAGDQPPLLGLCVGVVLGGLVGRDRRLILAGVRMGGAHILATAVKNFVKARIDRTRPRTAVGTGSGTGMKLGRSEKKEETSFPSGHSAGAAAVVRALARDFPEASGGAYAAAGLLALAQIPRRAHYPSDVGAGLAIGLAAEAAVSALLPRLDAFD
jgi:membrane-associated phospholipid phosphatase